MTAGSATPASPGLDLSSTLHANLLVEVKTANADMRMLVEKQSQALERLGESMQTSTKLQQLMLEQLMSLKKA